MLMDGQDVLRLFTWLILSGHPAFLPIYRKDDDP